jgi:predicted glycosyltransferase involved in capsule biosynthesis
MIYVSLLFYPYGQIFFLNIDIFISAINFSNTLNGIYFTFSIFIKYLILAFVILNIEKIKNIFNEKSIAVINSNINILIFISFVSTIFSFFISYVLVGLFFNSTAVSALVYTTGVKSTVLLGYTFGKHEVLGGFGVTNYFESRSLTTLELSLGYLYKFR